MKSNTQRLVETLILIAGCVLAPGCVRAADGDSRTVSNAPPIATNTFVQGDTTIVPPIKHAEIQPALDDGGTIRATLTDAKGKKCIIYIDHRIRSSTPGDVYLYAYPSKKGSVHVLNQREFRSKIGNFDKGPSSSF